MIFQKIFPQSCKLMTWEYSTNFDQFPSEKIVREKFSQEMPLTWNHPDVATDRIQFWPMISFNSQEGRRFRFLVAIPQEHTAVIKKQRGLPCQIGLFHVADQTMKNETEFSNNEGNSFFWSVHRGTLYLLVFYEGRLCHWSEENGYENTQEAFLEKRLERFRNFLHEDDLFSRGEKFAEKQIEFPEGEYSFLQASRDPFFRKLNLEKADVSLPLKNEKLKRFFFISAALACLFVYLKNFRESFFDSIEIPDVEPVALLEAPSEERTEEFREKISDVPVVEKEIPRQSSSSQVQEVPKSVCRLPSFRVKGIVGNRFAMVEGCGVECSGEILSADDSVGNYVVQKVGRDRLYLSCDSSSLELFVK